MSCPDPLSSQAPTSPMMDGRSPRIHLSLTIWTLVLIGSVLVEPRHLPPGLTVLLVPYLVLMAWHWMVVSADGTLVEPAICCDDAAGSPSDDESDECADFPGSGDRPGSIDPHSRHRADPPEEPASPPITARPGTAAGQGSRARTARRLLGPGPARSLRPVRGDFAGAPRRRIRRRQPDRRASWGYATR